MTDEQIQYAYEQLEYLARLILRDMNSWKRKDAIQDCIPTVVQKFDKYYQPKYGINASLITKESLIEPSDKFI